MEQNVVLEMRDISKNFTGVRALSHVDFTLRKGEIHALMGENGAGKSTLIKVLTGVHEFESGTIHMAGNSNAIINHSPQEAQANGISTVYQEVNLCPNLTVAENLFIGREPRKMGMIDWKQMNERSGKLLESLDIHVPPTQMLDECSIAIQQMIAIARAVDMKCQVLILDEPTSSLDDDEVEKLFVLMRRLRDEEKPSMFDFFIYTAPEMEISSLLPISWSRYMQSATGLQFFVMVNLLGNMRRKIFRE